MYFTSLPDHSKPGFDEQRHFEQFKKHNIIFNALSQQSYCDNHVGCLSFKTVLSGEEWYGVNRNQLAVRPGQFLLLNNDQNYSCRIDTEQSSRCFSIFFKSEFASTVFQDAISSEEILLDDPFRLSEKPLEFFQTLNAITPKLQMQLDDLLLFLDRWGYNAYGIDEKLSSILLEFIGIHKIELKRSKQVEAIKTSTKTELYKRLCTAKDLLHSSYMDNPDLATIGKASCLSISQLVRQFKAAFGLTPHQYLIRIKLNKAAELLQNTSMGVNEITWSCGFENQSAFCRAFKESYGLQPNIFRATKK
ncbi:AraC family transcriptional regulator [Pedobacter sp. KR3-3]|uniref:AraC family transcriptional regulator n=1 Tax=Pedobacter albus TaxID=3113905 RepID=A0ABU7I441_9SPHI|nr:AraC family transcriptional regulator [Pedobacter sp. KR3-3]MEE1944219.1 AraC family transcriptional regulator [Pedobacter sp. KR3-3]